MNSKIIHETTALAFEGKISFGEVVMKLIKIGMERCHADLATLQKTFYFKSGETHTEKLVLENAPDIAEEFDAACVSAAIKLSQGGKIIYTQFLEIVMRSGCAHYDVYIDDKQVIYFGRKGGFRVEKFPQPK